MWWLIPVERLEPYVKLSRGDGTQPALLCPQCRGGKVHPEAPSDGGIQLRDYTSRESVCCGGEEKEEKQLEHACRRK